MQLVLKKSQEEVKKYTNRNQKEPVKYNVGKRLGIVYGEEENK